MRGCRLLDLHGSAWLLASCFGAFMIAHALSLLCMVDALLAERWAGRAWSCEGEQL
jgi:hypothetical protein